MHRSHKLLTILQSATVTMWYCVRFDKVAGDEQQNTDISAVQMLRRKLGCLEPVVHWKQRFMFACQVLDLQRADHQCQINA